MEQKKYCIKIQAEDYDRIFVFNTEYDRSEALEILAYYGDYQNYELYTKEA